MNINVNNHNSIQIDNLFFDPYMTENVEGKADYIFITHPHYDHLSIKDIERVCKPTTTFIACKDAKESLESAFPANKKIYVRPNENYNLENLEIETLPAYNLNKAFHPKSNEWVGFKIIANGVSYAVLGDTDATPELEKLSCDVLFVPIGGTYTMNAQEGAKLANKISPKIAVPTHYGAIVGSFDDALTFKKQLSKNIECKMFLK